MKSALILAAGRGERLRPLTNFIPKALCPINGIPLLEHHVNKLAAAGFTRVVINHAYLGGLIRRQIGNGARWGIQIIYSAEPPGGLETLGGVLNALPYLNSNWFAVINADIFSEYDYLDLDLPQKPAHIVICPNPKYRKNGDFDCNQNTIFVSKDNPYTFAGIAVYQRILFDKLPLQRASLSPLLYELAAQQKLSAVIFKKNWFDIGTLERYCNALTKAKESSVGLSKNL